MTGLLDFLMAVGTVDEGFNISLAMLLPAFRNEVERDCRCVSGELQDFVQRNRNHTSRIRLRVSVTVSNSQWPISANVVFY